MRPRTTKFGLKKYKDLDKLLTDNYCFGFTVHISKDILTYSYLMMFRDNKKDPKMLYIDVSTVSKNVVSAYTDSHKFNTFQELESYIKYKKL